MIPFDPTLPVVTRHGDEARILATNIRGDMPLAVAVAEDDGSERVWLYYADGTFERDGTRCGLDLVNVALELTASAA